MPTFCSVSTTPIDPALFEPLVMRRALAIRDISTVFQMVTQAGESQRQIADLTGTLQSEVTDLSELDCELIRSARNAAPASRPYSDSAAMTSRPAACIPYPGLALSGG